MKIQKIGIESVLHFKRFEIDLGRDNSFHIFYGPNEAGKSTLLKLLIDLLFGGKIDEDLKQHFDTRSRLEAILHHTSLPLIHFYRKRRYSKLVLVGEDGKDLSHDILSPYLSGYQKEQYALLFGFDHERLRKGGESLLQSGGHAGISLFESGGGIQYLQQILQQLNDRTKELLDPTFRKSSSKLLNKSWKQYKDSMNAVKEKGLRGEDWHKKANEIDEKKKALTLLQEELEKIQGEIAKKRRGQRIWKPYRDRKNLLSQFETLKGIPTLSEEMIQYVTDVLENYQKVKGEKAKGKAKYTQKQSLEEQIRYDQKILQLGTEIHSLNEKVQQYITRKMKEIPEDRRSMNEWKEEARLLLASIAPSVPIQEADQLQIPYSDEEDILMLAEDIKKWELSLQGERERLDEQSFERSKIQRELDGMKDPVDPAPFEQLIRQVQREGDIDDQIEKTKREWEMGKQTIRRIQKEQNIWTESIQKLADISIPLQETIEKYTERWTELEKKKEEIEQGLVKEKQQLKDTIDRLEQIELGGYVPVEDDLKRARMNRNEHWDQVKSVWLENQKEENWDFSDIESLATTFERSMEEADEIADLMRRESDRSAKRANLLLQKQQTEKGIGQLEERLLANEREFSALKENWEKEWEISGIEPKSPREMKEWLNAFYRPVLEEWKKVKESEHQYDDMLRKKATLLNELKNAVQTIGFQSPSDEEHIEIFLQKIETFVKKAEEKRINIENLKNRLKDSELKIAVQKQKVEQLDKQLQIAKEKWEKIQRKYPHLGENPEVAKSTIEKLRKLFQIISNMNRTEQSIRNKNADCEDFENQVKDLAKRLSENLSDYPSIESFVRTLRETYEMEKEKKTKADEIRKQLKEIEMEILENEQKEAEYKQILESYMNTYHCTTYDELQELLHRAIHKKDLEEKIQDTEERLMEAGDFLPLDQLEKEAESIENPDILPNQIEQLEEKFEELETRMKDEKEHLWQLEREFEEMNETKTDAIMYSQKAESYLAEVDQYWNEYLRFELAKRLLQRAIDQYRRKNESTVIKKASNFFQQLTIDHYKQLIIDYEENVPLLVAIDRRGEKRKVHEMSDGTRDQLYLALRLAFVENHLDDSDPLPLIMDDIFVHFDDERTKATLAILNEFASKTQILYFTHHQFVVDAAKHIGANLRIHHIENKQMEPVE
ncbi:AAA family ATPase [Fervidibacillus halotolerans]|uniref:AAA family ATPase n=1 Tax=Fervidibacillus halotolerans TaxID=2980027 RepID=A0A9E8RZK4_9BACI|nr:AAA family ATPase [Fervidibacillus halotolerans]WAA13443.1 AAA family ATPase [Fervidibacillus halotolerans]